jgi:hypothetical protein
LPFTMPSIGLCIYVPLNTHTQTHTHIYMHICDWLATLIADYASFRNCRGKLLLLVKKREKLQLIQVEKIKINHSIIKCFFCPRLLNLILMNKKRKWDYV